MTLDEALALPRVAIAGVPDSGKTTLSRRFGTSRAVIHTDDLIHSGLAWSEQSERIVQDCAKRETYCVEGVRVAHALRKGLRPSVAIWMPESYAELTGRRLGMAKAIITVFEEWRDMSAGTVPIVEIDGENHDRKTKAGEIAW